MGVFDVLVRIYESVRIYEFDIKMISPLPNLFKHVFVQYMFVNLFKQLISVSICAYLSKQVYQLQKCRKCNCINPYFSMVFSYIGGYIYIAHPGGSGRQEKCTESAPLCHKAAFQSALDGRSG